MKPEEAGHCGLAIALGAVCIAPFLYLALLSVAGSWAFPRLWPAGLVLERWAFLGADRGGLARSLIVSIALSAAVAAVSTALGFLTSRAIAYHRRRRLWLFLAYVPFVLSPAILGVCLLYVFLRLELAGGLAGVALAQILLGYGFATVFFQGFWNQERKEQADLVATLGGSSGQLYLRVYLPLGRELLAVAFFQTFLLSWFQYGSTVLIGSGNVKTLPLLVYDYLGEANAGYAALAGCLLVLPPLLLLATNRRILFRAP